MKTTVKSLPKSTNIMTSKDVFPLLARVIRFLHAWSCPQCERFTSLTELKCAHCGYKVKKNDNHS